MALVHSFGRPVQRCAQALLTTPSTCDPDRGRLERARTRCARPRSTTLQPGRLHSATVLGLRPAVSAGMGIG
eukprot:8357732-Alexandrium_andersonii.AAC.1